MFCNNGKSSLQIWSEFEEKDKIEEIIQQILLDQSSGKGAYADWYFLLEQSDNGMNWFCNALDYAEKHGIIMPADSYDMSVRPVSIEVFREVRKNRKHQRND